MEDMLRRRTQILQVDLAGLDLDVNEMQRRLVSIEDEIQAEVEGQLPISGTAVLTENLTHLLKLAEMQRTAVQEARELVTIKGRQIAAARVMLTNYLNDHVDTLTNGLQNLATTTTLIHHLSAVIPPNGTIVIPQNGTTVVPQNGTIAADHPSQSANEVVSPNVEAAGVTGNPAPVVGLLEAKTDGTTDDSGNSGEEDTINVNIQPKLYNTHLHRHKKFPSIVQDNNGKWYELHCKHCGTNVGDNGRNWLSGTLGLGRHLAKDHGLSRPWTMNMHNYIVQILANANKREVSEDELKRIETDPTYKLSRIYRFQLLNNAQNPTNVRTQVAPQGQAATQGQAARQDQALMQDQAATQDQVATQGQAAEQGQSAEQGQAPRPSVVRYSLRSLFRR